MLIDLHSHLEGRVRPDTAAELAAELGVPAPAGGWQQAIRLEGPADLAPGDLVFYSTIGPGATHVGIVLPGDGSRFIHAPADGSVVREERMDTPYWEHRWVGARRVF